MILSCAALSKAGFVHAFSTRGHGNFSPNHGTQESVDENRRKLLLDVGQTGWPISTLHQIHSDNIFLAPVADSQEGDALLVSDPGHFVGIKTADCVPVLLGDPVTKTAAAVHAGWRGTLHRIVEKTIQQMVLRFNACAENVIAAIGPSACGGCYEVGEDVATSFKTEFSETRSFLLPSATIGKFLLNGPGANATQLIQSGLRVENIHIIEQCTIHHNNLFFSHRKDNALGGPIGRQLSIIGRL